VAVGCQICTAAGRATRWHDAVILDWVLVAADMMGPLKILTLSRGLMVARRDFRVLHSSIVRMSRIITVPYDRNG
jgi:hypothetical protein